MTDTPLFDMVGVVRRQLHLILVIDCSGSMTGEKMASLNYAIASAVPAIRAAAAENPDTDVRLRILRFSDQAQWHVEEATPVADFSWTDLTAEGETRLGSALTALATSLTPEAMPGRQLSPVIVLVSDGQPTDDFASGQAALMASPYGAKSVRIAIAIGSDADLDVLNAFVAHPEFKVLQAHNAEELVNRIKWATTAPVKTVSSPTKVSGTAVDQLSQQAPVDTVQSSELVW